MSDNTRHAYQTFQQETARETTPTPRTHDSERAYKINDAGQARWQASTAIEQWGESKSELIAHAKAQLAGSHDLGKQADQSGLSKVEQAIRERIATRRHNERHQARTIESPSLKR